MKNILCPRCGTAVERAIEETEIVELRSGPRRVQFDGAQTRRALPCGCAFAPGEFQMLFSATTGKPE